MKTKRIFFVLGFIVLFILGSFAEALGRGGFCDRTAKELGFSYKSTLGDDSFVKKREFVVYIDTSLQACTMTCYYDDNIGKNYDAVKIIACDVAPGFVASGLVWNSDGDISGYTANILAGQSSEKKKVEHTGKNTKWRMFIGEDK